MDKRFINGTDFMSLVFSGAERLNLNAEKVNALNVFPVPDGDTGSNMNLTMASGVAHLRQKPSPHLGKAAEILAKGLLMGARGNSGVILSQLFRGFAKSVAGLEEMNTMQFAQAMQQGVDTAYQAVVRPVEGTILTVSRETARHAATAARHHTDMREWMQEVVFHAGEALAKTPDLLPVLKQVGVVDSGGQGLVFIYEGFLAALQDGFAYETVPAAEAAWPAAGRPVIYGDEDLSEAALSFKEKTSAQSKIATESIEFRYDMEFFILLSADRERTISFDEVFFKRELEKDGDSILVIVTDDIVKVHVHSRKPGDVLNLALTYGELSRIQIENMRDQHRRLLENEERRPHPAAIADSETPTDKSEFASKQSFAKRCGIIAVAAGEGTAAIFESLGADAVIAGGQTMNPSTEDIVAAVRQVNAEHVFILPNNSNIIMAAKQANDLVEHDVIVIPSKTVPQGMSAMLAFQQHAEPEHNSRSMNDALQKVRSGQVTYAVRDTQLEGIAIKEGDFIGIQDSGIVASTPDLLETSRRLLTSMLESGGEMVTFLTGQDALDEQTSALRQFIGEQYPDVECEVYEGGQPLYTYIFSVE